MTSQSHEDCANLSALVFGPQSKPPSEEYLDLLQQFLLNHAKLRRLNQVLCTLPDLLVQLSAEHPELATLPQGINYTQILADWAAGAPSRTIINAQSGFITLPLLVVIQTAQYFHFLHSRNLNHAHLLSRLRAAGGLQGYCGGLPCATAIAASENEDEVVHYAAIALRLAFVIGAFSETGDDSTIPGTTMVAMRVKTEQQGQELVGRHPGTYISAYTDPKTISIVGSSEAIAALCKDACNMGLLVQSLPLRGKWHNPENLDLANKLAEWCETKASLSLAPAEAFRVPVRSNLTGRNLTQGSMTSEMVIALLASCCEWHTILTNVAEDLMHTDRKDHTIAMFGIGDCTPLLAFNKCGLQVKKIEGWALFQQLASPESAASIAADDGQRYFYPKEAIAVVGASCRLPGANNLEELWTLISGGIDRHAELNNDRFDLRDGFRTSQCSNFASERKFFANLVDNVDDFDHAFFRVNPREAVTMDPQQRMLMELAYEAMESSGYIKSHDRKAGNSVGCFIGASFVEYLDNTNAHAPSAYTSTGTIRGFLCGRLAHYFGWTGPAEVIDTACSSSLVAVNRACKAIQHGECSLALAGGVNIISGINNFLDLARAGFLSPTGQCKPFDISADGYCRSDGAGLVVLKRLSQAIAEGDQILAVIPGVATNQGGLSASMTIPSATAQKSLYRNVLQQAGMRSDQVTYVEAHGTGTQAGDPLEIESIREVLGSSDRRSRLHVGSIKGNIGHCETAAGVAGLLKAIAMINHGAIPAQANHKTLNPKIPPLEPSKMAIACTQIPWLSPLRASLVNSYGAAGSNAAVLVCNAPKENSPSKSDSLLVSNNTYPLILSAMSPASLSAYARTLSNYLKSAQAPLSIADVAYTLDVRRKRQKHCIVEQVSSIPEFCEKLESNLPSFDVAVNSKPLVLVFSGQEKQNVGLDAKFYSQNVRFRSYVNECNDALQDLGFPSLFPHIFQQNTIDDPVVLQCGLVTVQIACARCWIDAGANVSAIVGHSLGELAALAVSGTLSLRDCLKLVASRAMLMKTKWGPERGTMLVVRSNRQAVTFSVKQFNDATVLESDKVEIACYNSDANQVIVGSSAAISKVETMLSMDPNLRHSGARRLNTSYGFHSRFTEPLLLELDQIAADLQWLVPQIPLETCTELAKDMLLQYSPAEHARKPVFFSDAIKRIEAHLGPCVWLEAGVNSGVMSLVKKSVNDAPANVFVNLSSSIDSSVSDATVSLWRSGFDIIPWNFLNVEASRGMQVWLPPYQFEKTKHWLPNIDRAAEMKQALQSPLITTTEKPKSTPKLVNLRARSQESPLLAEFSVDTTCDRFAKIVAGHRVRQRPLCPASMYMECAIMGVELLGKNIKDRPPRFEEVEYHAALGLDPDRNVSFTLEETSTGSVWNFVFKSSLRTNPSGRDLVHAKGRLSFANEPNYSVFQRLSANRARELASSDTVEKLMRRRAYGLFSTVVHYEPFLQCIKSIAMDSQEAVAEISIAESQPGRENSSAFPVCDSVTIDTFIQVVGLLMNSSDLVGSGEVMVATGLHEASFSSNCRIERVNSWRVYAKFDPLDGTSAVGDVLVFTSEGAMVAMLNGCTFNKVSIPRLEKMLDAASSHAGRTLEVSRPPSSRQSRSVGPDAGCETPTNNVGVTSDIGVAANSMRLGELREVLAMYVGINADDITTDKPLGDLGLDSLAASELSGDLSSRFGTTIDALDLPLATLSSIASLQILETVVTPKSTNFEQAKLDLKSGIVTAQPYQTALSNESLSWAKLCQLLNEISGVPQDAIERDAVLSHLGIDSLALIELTDAIDQAFGVKSDDANFTTSSTAQEILAYLKHGDMAATVDVDGLSVVATTIETCGPSDASSVGLSSPASTLDEFVMPLPSPIDELLRCNGDFHQAAVAHRFDQYWSTVSGSQQRLLLAYILEAFQKLGIDLWAFPPDQVIPPIPCKVKYHRATSRYWEILQAEGVVAKHNNTYVRTAKVIDNQPSHLLLSDFTAKYPMYQSEANLVALTGKHLAECLSGSSDPISLMFANEAGAKVMEEYYSNSPMLATMTDHLVNYITSWLIQANKLRLREFNILEVGAGTGGTTKLLAAALAKLGIRVRYTFSDISPSMVRKAKVKLAGYDWMEFVVLDLEKEPSEQFRGRYDIIVGTNCVHATSDRVKVLTRLHNMLSHSGFVVLSEVTRVIDWYDICFGLLDGWWLAEGGTAYPLQPADVWISYMKKAGFALTGHSSGSSAESTSQQLLVGCKTLNFQPSGLAQSVDARAKEYIGGEWSLSTFTYKQVEGVNIEADVFVPRQPSLVPMPIALLIHGGGYMTLSRRAIRSEQVRHLLGHGILPVSIDYRLAPQVNIIDGAISDVADAYAWVQQSLPDLVAGHGIQLDPTNVVVVGWSTGGHLATTTAWSTKQRGLSAPRAILCFYAPLVFEFGELEIPLTNKLPPRRMKMEDIITSLSAGPVSHHVAPGNEDAELGWVRAHDPRSELLLSAFSEATGLSLLLNDIPCGSNFAAQSQPLSALLRQPSPERSAAICPLAQLKKGNYSVPTFIIHGDEDQVAPFDSACLFHETLKQQGVPTAMLPLRGALHLHDVRLQPGSLQWAEQVAPGYDFLFEALKLAQS